MKILALDVSTKTGWTLLDSEKKNIEFGNIYSKIEDFNVNDYPELSPKYPFNLLDAADLMGKQITDLYLKILPDVIVIENTVKGRNRHVQRGLEWYHKSILDSLRGFKNIKIVYMDPSQWRKIVDLRLSKEDKENNKLVSKGKKRGRINKKHLSVRLANQLYGLNLKIKDNDIADSILLATAYLASLSLKAS